MIVNASKTFDAVGSISLAPIIAAATWGVANAILTAANISPCTIT